MHRFLRDFCLEFAILDHFGARLSESVTRKGPPFLVAEQHQNGGGVLGESGKIIFLGGFSFSQSSFTPLMCNAFNLGTGQSERDPGSDSALKNKYKYTFLPPCGQLPMIMKLIDIEGLGQK